MPGWNLADIWEVVAEVRGDAVAQVHGDRRQPWSDLDRRADGVAARLLAGGVVHQDKVAQYLYNCPEYLESVYACFKAGLVPVNTNYRYTDDELAYLWDNADAVAVVFHGTFDERVAAVRTRVPAVRTWLWVDDGSGPCPEWAEPYEDAALSASGRVVPPWQRDGDDLFFIYTGGTTGMPKGVMWRQDDLVAILTALGGELPEGGGPDDVRARLARGTSLVVLAAAPLMHGTGALVSMSALIDGSAIVTVPNRSFDPRGLLDTIQREKVSMVVLVGDAFSRPLLDALDAEPERWDLSSLVAIVSSGAMWSEPVRTRLLAHHPGMVLIDALGSSEAVGMGASMSAGAAGPTARFALGESAVVLADDGRLLEPGSGEIGRLGVRGRVPVGYYKDPEKSAATFPVIDGVRYSLPGDYAMVEADGSLTLLGRGSVCINTGGEKVFPEEVEEALKTHAAVRDAVAVGVPDERFGERIVAVVEEEPGAASADESEVIDHVKARLAPFKAPRAVVVVESIGRAPNGKVDYKRLRQLAVERLAVR